MNIREILENVYGELSVAYQDANDDKIKDAISSALQNVRFAHMATAN